MSAQDFSIPGGVVDMARKRVELAKWLLFRVVVLHGGEAECYDDWSKCEEGRWEDDKPADILEGALAGARPGQPVWINLNLLFDEAAFRFGPCIVYAALFWDREGVCEATLIAGNRYLGVPQIELVRQRMSGPSWLVPTESPPCGQPQVGGLADAGDLAHTGLELGTLRGPDDDRIPTYWYGCWRCWFDDILTLSMMKNPEFLFRGDRRRCRSLQSRIVDVAKGEPTDATQDMLDRFVQVVARRAKVDRGNPGDREWALGQHHGLVTPLLDWTQSGLVAAFFALAEPCAECELFDNVAGDNACDKHPCVPVPKEERTCSGCSNLRAQDVSGRPYVSGRVVWVLNRDGLNVKENAGTSTARIRLIEEAEPDNARMIAQRSVFTIVEDGIPVDHWAAHALDSQTAGEDVPVLVKLVYTGCDRFAALRYLNAMNINHATLFPDIEGACRYCNMALEIEKYAPAPPHHSRNGAGLD